MTTRPDPTSSAAIPTSHSSDKNAPVKAIDGVVLTGGVAPPGGAGTRDVVVVGRLTGVMTGATVTLPGT
jgi:hypothetical protein